MACLTKRSDAEVRRIQAEALRKVVAGDGELITVAQSGVRHVKAFTVEKTFCGRDVHVNDRRGRIDLHLESLTVVCPHCRQAIEELIEEGKVHAASSAGIDH
jgi:hypothetical protein